MIVAERRMPIVSFPHAHSGMQNDTLERQNDAELNSLHGKIRSLRGVTIDIFNDSEAQNQQVGR